MTTGTKEYWTRATPMYQLVDQLRVNFPGEINVTHSDQSRQIQALLQEKSPLYDVVYFKNSQGQRIGEWHFLEDTLDIRVLDDTFLAYKTTIENKYKSQNLTFPKQSL